MIAELLKEISSQGNYGAAVPFSRVDSIKQDMIDIKNGTFHTNIHDRMINHTLDESEPYLPEVMDFEPRSLISVIMPCFEQTVQFDYRGKTVSCRVPPLYTGWDERNENSLQYLSDFLRPLGYSVAIAKRFPQKLLAAHCGLGKYGRNNIFYSEEFGSHLHIMTFVSDLPCDETTWLPLSRMDRCEECSVCTKACPTAAIDPGRRLIDTDRCLTFYNEYPGEFPEWIEKDAHNSLFGCIRCQDFCPANAHNKGNVITGFRFTEAETEELLENKGEEPFSDALSNRLREAGLSPDFTGYLPRNLAVLLLA